MDKFAEIRPYNDDEVHTVIERIIADDECISAIARLKFPRMPQFLMGLVKPVVRRVLHKQMDDVNSVQDFQDKVAIYMEHMVESTMTRFSVSGVEKLERDKAYLFIGNHRDITLDPAFVNYALYHSGRGTVRIAIGDNLLTKDFATHLMRINKSFIVKRSEKAPRKLLAALKLLSQYISHSLLEDNHSIWIAQREGRAKDGIDKSDVAIIKMFAIDARKQVFSEFIRSLNIVPVSISYEYDPCDQMKANELYQLEKTGEYTKGDQEDIASIARGIAGDKGHVHLSFGEVLSETIETPEAVAEWLDRQIVDLYVLHPSNYFAYEKLYGEFPQGVYSEKALPFNAQGLSKERKQFDMRLAEVPENLRENFLKAYANPIVSKKNFGLMR